MTAIQRSIAYHISTVSDYYQGPWAMIGDFNEMVNPDEKFGGASFNYSRARVDCMNTCGMIDLGYTGPKFTWFQLDNAGIFFITKIEWLINESLVIGVAL
uniref:Endonuclease/exonuclease/phosphatase domain-containing protein n=1 Tax=Manihot esculenta TaxID=3983 RepID=A0A199U9R4_MANES